MKKQKIYHDTSVVSYLHQEDASEKMRDTLKSEEIVADTKAGAADLLEIMKKRKLMKA